MPVIIFVCAAVLVGLDQFFKYLAVTNLKPVHDVPLIQGWLHLTYEENRGAAFGILANARWVFISISIILVIAAVILVILKKADHPMSQTAAALIIAGGIGNLIDRISAGYVVDYINVEIINFAVFNFADMCVCIGAVLLAWYVLFVHGREDALQGKGKSKSYGERVYKNPGDK